MSGLPTAAARALLAWHAWREPRRRVWTVWAGVGAGQAVPVAHRKTRVQAAGMLAGRAGWAAVDARRAPPGGPPAEAAGQPWVLLPPPVGEYTGA